MFKLLRKNEKMVLCLLGQQNKLTRYTLHWTKLHAPK